jgi:DNA ligase (NAD+)
VLFSLGIRHVGETVAKTLAARFENIDSLINASLQELTSVNEIGPKIGSSIITYFADKENMELISRLKDKGIRFSTDKTKVNTGNKLSGKVIVISGVFQKHSREEYKEIIEANSGKNSSSVSSSTTFILAGENMGQSKKDKAKELGIPILDEEEFLKIIDEEKSS